MYEILFRFWTYLKGPKRANNNWPSRPNRVQPFEVKWCYLPIKYTIMRISLTALFLSLFFVHVGAHVSAQRITLKKETISLMDFFREVRKQSSYDFVYDQSLATSKDKYISIDVHEADIQQTLSQALKDLPLTWAIKDEVIVINDKQSFAKEEVVQQNIKGRVYNEQGQPLEGATVHHKGKNYITDANGEFDIPAQNGDRVTVNFIGYQSSEITIKNQASLSVTMVPRHEQMEDIVVVGYGQQKKATVTGALSSIGTKELTQSPQANISNMLVGRLPGLLAVQRSGQPGEDQSTIRIRGIGTFGGNADPLIMVDGIEGVNLNNIDPNEIESVSILKDASATAVYGVRGANGVVLVTTRRGAVGKPQVNLSTNFATTSFIDMRQGSGAYDWANGYNDANKYDSYITGSYAEKYNPDDLEKYRTGSDPIFYPDVDWFSTMYRKSAGQSQHNLNVNGGVERVKYFISAGYFNQEGMFNEKVTDYMEEYNMQPIFHRYNFRSNMDFTILKGLTANMNIAYQFEERQGAFEDLNARISNITRSNPVHSPGLLDGHLITLNQGAGAATTVINTLFLSSYSRRHRNYLNAMTRLNYDLSFITKGLSTHGTLSYGNYNTQDGSFYNPVVLYQPIRNTDGSILYVPMNEEGRITYSESVAKNRREYFEFGINYSRMFSGHNVSGLLLYNQNKYHDPTLAFLVPNSHQGLVGRITYDFKGRYMAEVNMGYNGTENFIEGKRFGLFPAYSLGWNVSEEPFFPKNDVLTYLKFRGSMGEVGNDKIGGDRFLYLPTPYNYRDGYYSFGEIGSTYQAYRGSAEGKAGNPALTWERARKTNVGIEAKFWNNAISVTADYFKEKRDNILANLGTVPNIVGAVLPAANFGRMSNGGFDGDIAFQHHISDVNYWVKVNFTYARNKVEFRDEVTRAYPYLQGTGQRFGQYFGLIADGFYSSWEEANDVARPFYGYTNNKVQPGDVRYMDVNADGIINNQDEVPIGYSNFPEKIGGLSFGGDYKGFDLSILFQWADNVSAAYSLNYRFGYREEAGIPQYLLDESWTHERYTNGETINFPRLAVGDNNNKHNYLNSSLWIRDASYTRLKNAEIGYTVKGSLLTRIGLSALRVYANGNNLITWSKLLKGIDPESNLYGTNNEPYPLTRTINFGLNIKL